METDMAPPAKRRRLSKSSSQDTLQSQSDILLLEPTPTFSHRVEHIEAKPTQQFTGTSTFPQVVEELHYEIRKRVVLPPQQHVRVHRRQGTAAASDVASPSQAIIVSIAASIDLNGSTTDISTATLTSDAASLTGSPTTTVTSLVGSGISSYGSSDVSSSSLVGTAVSASSDLSASSSVSNGFTSSTSSGASSSTSNATSSPTSSDSLSSSSNASSTSSYAPTTTGPEGMIGFTQGTASTSSTASAALSTLSASNSSTTAMSSGSTLVAGTVDGYTASSMSASQSFGSQNFTTSATTFTSNGSTYTSSSTIDLGAISSSSASQTSSVSGSASHTSSGVFIPPVFLATLSDGRVATVTRSNHPYVTTFPGGQVSTISPYSSAASSASSGSSGSSASSALSTEATTSRSDAQSTQQSTVQSVVYSTEMISGSAVAVPVSTITSMVGVAGGAVASTSSSASSSTKTGGGGNGGAAGPATAPPGTIAGGVVGGAAGLAFVLLIAMLFLRWYRRKAQLGHQALPPNSGNLSPDMSQASRSGPGMAERAGLMPFVGAVPALFRHHNRSQEAAPVEPAAGAERGFTRVSGRKLPSAFSEGMSSPPPPTMPLVNSDRNLSSTSFYRDSTGFYGGEGLTPSPDPFADHPGRLSPLDTSGAAAAAHGANEQLTMSPGPERRPTVHAGGPYVMNPGNSNMTTGNLLSPGSPSAATFARSDTPASFDGSRGSRFMEEV